MSESQRHSILFFGAFFLVIIVGFAAVMLRIGYLQTAERQELLQYTKAQVFSNVSVPAERGNILDCRGRLLASSMPQYVVYFDGGVEALHGKGDTLFTKHGEQFAQELATIIGDHSADDYHRILKDAHRRHKRNLRLSKRRINYVQRTALLQTQWVKRGRYKSGITFVSEPRRIKPFGIMASRTIGSVNGETGDGRTGLEFAYNDVLSGTPGKATRMRVNGGYSDISIVEPKPGRDVVTTIDADLQDIVESTLKAKMERSDGDWGCAILLDTETGAIRALANLDRSEDGSYYEGDNHAIRKVEPGSTFKTISLLAALDDDLIELDDTVSITSEPWRYFTVKHTDSHRKDTVLTVSDALAISSNIALAKLITRSYKGSAKKFVKRVRKFGIQDVRIADFSGGDSAVIRAYNDTVTLSKMSYGYSVELTPIQIAAFYNAIANDGRLMQPYLVSEIREEDEVVKRFEPKKIKGQIASSSALRDIRHALHEVVWNNHLGTAAKGRWGQKKAQSQLVAIAGKTGTAQILQPTGYSHRNHRMTFVGYFPEDKPRYTCLVMIENPKDSNERYYYHDSGADCGGAVREIAEKVIAKTCVYRMDRGELKMDYDIQR